MSKLLVSDMLAKAFAAEGVDTLFTLMGDANMYWSATMSETPGVRVVHARHESCAVSMADGYARATGKVGVASTTCGPGFTQIMTSLTMAARANTPLVVFAGDAPIAAAWYLQQIDMAPLGARDRRALRGHTPRRPPARQRARGLPRRRDRATPSGAERAHGHAERSPIRIFPTIRRRADLVPVAQRPIPDPAIVDRVVELIAKAEKPIIIAGRGATRSGARVELEALAELSGALLATSLLGKGLFEGNPYALDVAGAFASDFSRERFAEADLVIGVGAGLGHYTTEGGYLYPGAQVVQIDVNPRGHWQGLRTADLHVRADARAAADAIANRLRQRNIKRTGFRTAEMARQIAADAPDRKEFPVQANTVDPRKAMLELDRVIPKDWDIVVGGGHYFSIAMTHLRGRPADKYHVINDFGAIGSGTGGRDRRSGRAR